MTTILAMIFGFGWVATLCILACVQSSLEDCKRQIRDLDAECDEYDAIVEDVRKAIGTDD